MANIKEQKLRKLKKSYVVGSMVGFIVIGTIVFAMFVSILVFFGLYIMDSKLRDEYQSAKNKSSLYELSQSTDDPKILSALNDLGSEYIIIDQNKKIISEHGENTCDLAAGGKIDILGISHSVAEAAIDDSNMNEEQIAAAVEAGEQIMGSDPVVYPDKVLRVIVPGISGRVRIDFVTLWNTILSQKGFVTDLSEENKDFVKLPFWIEVPLSSGDSMVCRANIVIYFRELAILGLLAANVAILSIIMLICLIVYLCKTIRNKKRMTEVFFMDEVTGKHNWMWFLTNAEQTLKKRSNAGVKFAVLDIVFVNYRNFCVCHSVKVGEQMLCKVYDTIQKHLRRKELAAHHSAAHFAALLTYSDRDELEKRIQDMTADMEKIDDDHKFSFWVGVDRISRSVDEKGRTSSRIFVDIEKEYNNAGAARATITGDDSAIAFFDEKMVEEQKWIDWISENQDRAIENEEFLVYYQPKYDPRTQKLRGAEALIRWDSRQYGMVSPGRFIPIFESNGFITKIDHYMLSHVAADQRKWLDLGYDCVPVSVNVSRAHFIESDLADQIRDIVDNAGTPHELIEIELTESAFFDDKHAMISTIRKLKEYGFTVSMDDFGSGYSSLNSLKEMPLDVLKLDADFFRNDDVDGRGQIVVSEAIKLAKSLNMRTVAEGVELKDQVDFLAEQGCDMIQGFYFAKPMPKDDFVLKMNGALTQA
ncbi:MAG: EAL domain-containing protein [Lachnospiraceae bacterium]|nr:EAL domain-containing protein [Lachnospiraceae bacterium]